MERYNLPKYPIPTYNSFQPLQDAYNQAHSPQRGPTQYTRHWRGRGRSRGRNRPYHYTRVPQRGGDGGNGESPTNPNPQPQWEPMNRNTPINGNEDVGEESQRKREN